jgi:hypothetical protein
MTMKQFGNMALKEKIWELWPALVTLAATFLLAAGEMEFTFVAGTNALFFILGRFLRLCFNLSLPLLLLPGTCALLQRVLNWNPRQLIQVKKEENTGFHAVQGWLLRPLQGIGLILLMATHFLRPLETYLNSLFSGQAMIVIPPGEFTPGRFINVALTAVLLSFVWMMDALGIRHYNCRTGEIRMVGKYLGFLLPTLTGFYGVYSLFKDQPPLAAVLLIAQRILIFYPPLVTFNLMQIYYVNKKRDLLLRKLKVKTGVVRVELDA